MVTETLKRAIRFKPVLACLFAALVLGLAACGGDDGDNGGETTAADTGGETAADSGGTTDVKMALSFPRSIYWSPLLAAEEKGFFEEEGLNVTVEETEGSGYVTQQVIAGNVEVGWGAAPDAVVAYSKDPDLRALMCNPPHNIFQIVVPEGSDITSVEELEGKVLGVTDIGGGEMPVVNAALADAGLEPGSDVQIQPIGPAGPQAATAIKDDKVQAYATSYIDLSALTADDGITFSDITPEKYAVIPGDCMIVKEEMLSDPEQRAVALGVARAWAKGTVWFMANRDAALELGCEVVPEECRNQAFAEQFIDDTLALFEPPEEGTPIGVVPDEAWITTADLLRETDTISGDVDIETFAFSDDIKAFHDEFMDFDQAEVEALD